MRELLDDLFSMLLVLCVTVDFIDADALSMTNKVFLAWLVIRIIYRLACK